MPKYRTVAQNKHLFGLASKLGLEHEDLRAMAFEYSRERTDHTSKLYLKEADALIKYLDGLANPVKHWSPRTINYRRQQAGIPQIATKKHLKLMRDLAAKRNIGEEGLERLCRRTIDQPYPRTTAETNKIIEAIKAMNRRDRISGAFKKEAA